jgi:hypothetical protein
LRFSRVKKYIICGLLSFVVGLRTLSQPVRVVSFFSFVLKQKKRGKRKIQGLATQAKKCFHSAALK